MLRGVHIYSGLCRADRVSNHPARERIQARAHRHHTHHTRTHTLHTLLRDGRNTRDIENEKWRDGSKGRPGKEKGRGGRRDTSERRLGSGRRKAYFLASRDVMADGLISCEDNSYTYVDRDDGNNRRKHEKHALEETREMFHQTVTDSNGFKRLL